MTKLNLFVVGPHDENRYNLIKNYIVKYCADRAGITGKSVEVSVPTGNEQNDRFNNWIFGKIDTCDALVVDMSGFNPNVIYEVAFAHNLGVPCIYLRFDEGREKEENDIKHYFKFSLMAKVSEASLQNPPQPGSAETISNPHFDRQLDRLLSGRIMSGETILSDYYGTIPVDAEFMRGLAEGYYRNFLGRQLMTALPSEYEKTPLYIAIPDTFEVSDSQIDAIKNKELPSEQIKFATNTLGRPLPISFTKSLENGAFVDIPTTILTVTRSHKYKNIFKQSGEFSIEDRDRLTDRLACKFVAALWEVILADRDKVNTLASRVKFVWLSQLVGPWHENTNLMNDTPFDRPEGF